MLYHLVTQSEWDEGRSDDFYAPQRFEGEGFIHSSFREQVLDTANRKFSGRDDLLILLVDDTRVNAKIVVEDLGNRGEKHPRIYGKLPLDAIISVEKMVHDDNGKFHEVPGGRHD